MMVYYVGHFSESDPKNTRNAYLSAENKMKYILTALQQQACGVRVVSCSKSGDSRFLPASRQSVNGVLAVFFASFGRKNILTKLLDILFLPLQLLVYLLKSVRADDVLLVYHATTCMNVIRAVKRIKRCRLVLELEEIYSDVNGNEKLRRKEMAMAQAADAFIFPTQLLNEAVNGEGKPFAVVHGTYQADEAQKRGFDDGKIHIVYAGTLDPRKGGTAAVAAAKYLPENYRVHILGFGSEQQVQQMRKLAEEGSAPGCAKVTYDGVLSGEEYTRFIQACDVGLSPQNPDAAFNATSFPSKVLSYMANGLRVVSIRIEAIETSAVGDLITYYDEQTPQSIAEAIRGIDMKAPYDSRKRIAELDERFRCELKALIEAK